MTLGTSSLNAKDWSHHFYNIDRVHARGRKGKGVKVAVLDTGIELSHNSFKTAVSEGRLNAYDFTGGNDPNDYGGHGTWVCSRYIAEGYGFSPECTLSSYKVLNSDGSGNLEDVKNALWDVIEGDYHIISTSIGWPKSVEGFSDIVQAVKDKGIIWLSASGNDGEWDGIDYPARYMDVISVGSHNKRGRKSKFSDTGYGLDLYSSGENVLGSYINNTSARLSGTSMATPSLGSLLALVYFDVIEKYGKIDRDILKKISTCL